MARQIGKVERVEDGLFPSGFALDLFRVTDHAMLCTGPINLCPKHRIIDIKAEPVVEPALLPEATE